MSTTANLTIAKVPAAKVPTTIPDDPSDDALMWQCKSGDQRAFAVIVTRHQNALRRVCALLLGDAAHARDVAQDSFVELWKSRERYQPQDKLKPLLFTIARNRCRSAVRRRRVAAFFVSEQRQQENLWASDAGASVDDRERQKILAAALAHLPEKFRLPLVLRFVDELEYEDIAKIIGRTESAARSRVHYALKALAEILPEGVYP